MTENLDQKLAKYLQQAKEEAAKPPLPTEQILWEGRANRSLVPLFCILIFYMGGILASVIYSFFSTDFTFLGMFILLTLCALVFSALWLYYSKPSYYILTSERLQGRSIVQGKEIVSDYDLEQVKEIKYHKGRFQSYIPLGFLVTLYPSKEPEKFYKALAKLHQTIQNNISPQKRALNYHLANPPIFRWIFYSLTVITLYYVPLMISFIVLPSTMRNIFGVIFGLILSFVQVTRLPSIVSSPIRELVLGKEYAQELQISFNYIWIRLGLAIPFSGLTLWLYFR